MAQFRFRRLSLLLSQVEASLLLSTIAPADPDLGNPDPRQCLFLRGTTLECTKARTHSKFRSYDTVLFIRAKPQAIATARGGP